MFLLAWLHRRGELFFLHLRNLRLNGHLLEFKVDTHKEFVQMCINEVLWFSYKIVHLEFNNYNQFRVG